MRGCAGKGGIGMDRGYDLDWLSRNATSISDSEKKREAFREVCRRENADGSITIFYIDQYGQYRYEKK